MLDLNNLLFLFEYLHSERTIGFPNGSFTLTDWYKELSREGDTYCQWQRQFLVSISVRNGF